MTMFSLNGYMKQMLMIGAQNSGPKRVVEIAC